MELLGLARPNMLNALENLQDLDMVRKRIGKERCRLHVYDCCSNILDEAPRTATFHSGKCLHERPSSEILASGWL